MATGDITSATTTNFKGKVPNFIVEAMKLDIANAGNGETYVYFDKAEENYGYYFNHPQVSSPINSLCTWAFGRGWTVEDPVVEVILNRIDGNGKDSFNGIIWNLEHGKLSQGDAFADIIRNDNQTLVNLIPISPERVKVVFVGPRIKRYEVWDGSKWNKKQPRDIFHIFNKRIGDQIHGSSIIQMNKNVNDTLLEAYADERVIKHRDKALGVVYYKTSNTGKIEYANEQIENAVKNGEMVGLPEDTAKIEPYPSRSSEDRQNWLQYNENLGYQTGGVPRNIATSDGTSEVGGINAHLIFEPIYGKEQLDMEDAFWSQLAIRIKWNRPPSLAPKVQENAEKNTGQTTIQPGEALPKVNR